MTARTCYVSQAVEILRMTELYSPQLMQEEQRTGTEDPVASDLIGALLSVSNYLLLHPWHP